MTIGCRFWSALTAPTPVTSQLVSAVSKSVDAIPADGMSRRLGFESQTGR